MNEKQLQALIRKTAAKAEKAKPKKRPSYDPTLDATRGADAEPLAPDTTPGEQDTLGGADEIFKEMKRRSF